jgi:drug/metabolite transporter (DMT)-like permease
MGFQVSIGLFYGVTKIPMSQNVMLLQLAQVAIPLVDRFLYRTKYSLIELSISVIAVFGVYLVLNGKE